MKTEIQKICDILTHSFKKNAWHGPAVLEVLSDIDENIVDNKINTTHSILELVGHMTAWKTFVTEKLQGNESFDVSEEMNFPTSKSLSEAVNSLRKSQEKLLQSLKQFPAERLTEVVPNRPYKFFTMIHGVIHHDLYHLGQIVLIKRIHE
ncbi:MAG: DinB family protein [Bacteroidota bacterium]